MKNGFAFALTLLTSITSSQTYAFTNADGSLTFHEIKQEKFNAIRDNKGHIQYIVQLSDHELEKMPEKLLRPSKFPNYQRSKAVNLVTAFEQDYNLHAIAMTSWASLIFIAFLTDEQVILLKNDPRVKNIFVNHSIVQSFNSIADATAVWNDQVNGSVAKSWGTVAVNSSATQASGSVLVYVVDGGVGQHQDLNVVEWANPNLSGGSIACGSRSGAGISPCVSSQMKNLVGCYPHATAVAGIAGAKGIGAVGVNPNVKIVSVATLSSADPTCLSLQSYNVANLAVALDWVAADISTYNANGLTSVVNISSNWDYGPDIAPIVQSIYNLSHPSSGPGALVVQSAGNDAQDACNHAYPNTSSSDGVLVVGGLNNHGQSVVPLTYTYSPNIFGFWKTSNVLGRAPGSNYGNCVELWAPGDSIYFPLANPTSYVTPTNIVQYPQNGNTVYTTYGFGSGTSFAAPHVSGLAAKLIQDGQIKSPSAAEVAVRGKAHSLGSTDLSGLSIKMPTLNGNLSYPSQTPYGEVRIESGSNVWINGINLSTNYDQSQSTPVFGGGFTLTFKSRGLSNYGCTLQRDYAPPFNGSPTNLATNVQLFGPTFYNWNPSGGASTVWMILSSCLPYGIQVIN